MNKTFFIADTHYGHSNMVSGTTKWDHPEMCRQFKTLEEHDNTIIQNINSIVGEQDELYLLGDVFFGKTSNLIRFRESIICKNIHLIFGNHDEEIEENNVIKGYWTMLGEDGTYVNNEEDCYHVVATRPQLLFKSVSHYKVIEIEGQTIILSHFPMLSWHKSYRGSWMLHGHCHNTLRYAYGPQWAADNNFIKSTKIFDVGIDWEEFRPYEFSELKDIMNKREVISVDHHNIKTKHA